MFPPLWHFKLPTHSTFHSVFPVLTTDSLSSTPIMVPKLPWDLSQILHQISSSLTYQWHYILLTSCGRNTFPWLSDICSFLHSFPLFSFCWPIFSQHWLFFSFQIPVLVSLLSLGKDYLQWWFHADLCVTFCKMYPVTLSLSPDHQVVIQMLILSLCLLLLILILLLLLPLQTS